MNHLKKFEELDWLKKIITNKKPDVIGREPIYGETPIIPKETEKESKSYISETLEGLSDYYNSNKSTLIRPSVSRTGSREIILNLSELALNQIQKSANFGEVNSGEIKIKFSHYESFRKNTRISFSFKIVFDSKVDLFKILEIKDSFHFKSRPYGMTLVIDRQQIYSRNSFDWNLLEEKTPQDIVGFIEKFSGWLCEGMFENLMKEIQTKKSENIRKQEEEKRKQESEKKERERISKFHSKIDEIEDHFIELYDMSSSHNRKTSDYRIQYFYQIEGIKMQDGNLIMNDKLHEIYKIIIQAKRRLDPLLKEFEGELKLYFKNGNIFIIVDIPQKFWVKSLWFDDEDARFQVVIYDDDEDWDEDDDDYDDDDYDDDDYDDDDYDDDDYDDDDW